MNINNEIKIKEYKFSEELNKKLLTFLKKYVDEIDINKWNWEYRFLDRKSDIFLAYLNENIIGHYACLNYKFVFYSKIINGAKAEGSYVNYRLF